MLALSDIREQATDRFWKGLIDPWFPVCIDRENGGFYEHLTRDWKAKGETERFVVYQSRLVWCSAQAFIRGRAEFEEITRTGVESLWNRFWDQENGGFYWRASLNGQPVDRSLHQKHTYGIAFALYSIAAAARALHSQLWLDRLAEAWFWFDDHMHDEVHSGYFEACSTKSVPLTSSPDGIPRDLLGVRYGEKAQNSQLHVLEAFTEVYRAWPDPRVAARLREMIEVISRKMMSEEGHLHLYCTRDWQPTSTEPSYGHDIEAAFLLRDALVALGEEDESVAQVSRNLARNALQHAWDKENGGLIDSFGGDRPPVKVWWVQAESLGALAWLCTEEDPGAVFFRPYLESQWMFLRDNHFDKEHGGLYSYVSVDGKTVHTQEKGNPWTGLYHEARALITVMDRLKWHPRVS